VIRRERFVRRLFVGYLAVDDPQLALGKVSDLARFVNVFEVDEKRAVGVRGTDVQCNYRAARDLDVFGQWGARVCEQAGVLPKAVITVADETCPFYS